MLLQSFVRVFLPLPLPLLSHRSLLAGSGHLLAGPATLASEQPLPVSSGDL